MLTAYDYPSARVAVAGGVDVMLVGDSAAMTVLGYSSTREISIDELLMLTRAVRRGVTDIPVIGDLPFGSYEESDELAVRSAKRFVDEAGCDAVKLEGAGEMVPRVRAILAAGIPVFGHVGLLPQSVRTREGYRAQGPRSRAGDRDRARRRRSFGGGVQRADRRGGAGGGDRDHHGSSGDSGDRHRCGRRD